MGEEDWYPVQVPRPERRLEHFKYTGKLPAVGDVIRVLVIYAVDVSQGSEIDVRVTEVDEDAITAQRLDDPPPGL